MSRILRRSASVGKGSMESINSSKKQNIRRTISFESVDVSQCLICENKINLPMMMKCRHTFCLQCFKNRLMISRKRDSSPICPICNVAAVTTKANRKESKSALSFVPLSLLYDKSCRTCSETCKNVNKCKHCKRRFCDDCWSNHVNDLKDELVNINGDLKTTAKRFEYKISNFQIKANETMNFVNRDIEIKIFEINKKRESLIKKVEHIIAAEELSVDNIRQKMQKTQMEIRQQKEVSYDTLSNNEEKVKTFLNLQQQAAEVMAAVAIWELELNDVELELGNVNKHEKLCIKEIDPLYKWKNFIPKVIVARDIVRRPSALTVDSWRDNIIIACPGSGRIVILNRKFKLVRKIRHQEMIAPQGVAFLQKHDEIYVTDKWKHCIFVFNHKGEFVYRMCNKGYGKSELCSPEGITFHPERSVLYVADTGNNRIQILEKDGTYLNSIGPKNKNTGDNVRFRKTSPSKLNQPTDVAVTIMHIVVADSGNHKIKIFNHDGQILQSIGGIGTTKGLFRSPEVLKIDDKGYIIVGDAGNGRVQIFSPEGKFLRVLGDKKTQGYKFAWVSGLLVTNNYNILVSDSKNNFVYLF